MGLFRLQFSFLQMVADLFNTTKNLVVRMLSPLSLMLGRPRGEVSCSTTLFASAFAMVVVPACAAVAIEVWFCIMESP
jgi:hypothetical protein